MQKGASTLLNADVLQALRAMGHGDELIVADITFPSNSIARQTRLGALLRIDNVTAAEAIEAVLSVYPLDTFVDDAAACREIVGSPDKVPPAQAEAQGTSKPQVQILADDFHRTLSFYERAKRAYYVIQTGERRFHGCFAFRKGVIPPDGK